MPLQALLDLWKLIQDYLNDRIKGPLIPYDEIEKELRGTSTRINLLKFQPCPRRGSDVLCLQTPLFLRSTLYSI